MSTIDQQFVEYIIKSLVANPDDVIVDRQVDEKGVLLTLTVNPDDLGRVIGKRGNTAQSVRTLLRALGIKNDARYNLKIVNNDDDRPIAKEVSEFSQESQQPGSSGELEDNLTDESVDNSDSKNDYAENARKELAELDDLDI